MKDLLICLCANVELKFPLAFISWKEIYFVVKRLDWKLGDLDLFSRLDTDFLGKRGRFT